MADSKAAALYSRVSTVDSLRGIACLAVCWFHFTNGSPTFLPAGLLKSSAVYGRLGPVVFFVISGFVVPYSLSRNAYRLSNYPTFLLKRVIRLHPPYLVSIGAIILIGLVSSKVPGYRGDPFTLSATQLVLHFGYLNE
ncbi:MAG TPA: acyltransferase family protein, partial [Blastocatellia bacterium]